MIEVHAYRCARCGYPGEAIGPPTSEMEVCPACEDFICDECEQDPCNCDEHARWRDEDSTELRAKEQGR